MGNTHMGVTNSNKVISTERISCDGALRVTLALTAAPDIVSNPTDIVLILDRSGSMTGAPLAAMKLGAKTFIDLIDEATDSAKDGQIGSGSRMGIVSFSNAATADTQLTTSVDALKAAVDGLTAGSSTNHADAFAKATQLFDPASSNAKVMVMFTDGNTTIGAPPAPLAAAARAQGIIIYCIGLIGSDGLDVSALNNWATDPDASHVAVTPDAADLEELFAELAANISKPGATGIVINEMVSPDFVITSIASPTKGSATMLDARSLRWNISQLGVSASESASLDFFIRHVGQQSGTKLVNASITYSDNEGNLVSFPKPTVAVECEIVVHPEPCPEPVELAVEGCQDSVLVDLGDTFLESQGRIIQMDVTIRNVCPGKRVALAAILWRQAGAPDVPVKGLEGYQDTAAVADWAKTAILWCIQAGVMSGRSDTQLAPDGSITVAEALLMLQRVQALPDVSGLQADLEALSAHHRAIGSEGEAAAVEYLKGRFADMGYDVSLYPYTNSQGQTGNCVVAVKPATAPNGDILILSAHHDSVPTAYGANDNASGVAALLYAAQALVGVDSDTEIRFISFTDEENGKNGSRAYTASLSQEEQARIIGDIQLDMLGGLGTDGTLVCTMDGEANWLSDLLQAQDPSWERGAETASDHASFQLLGVPSVLVMQDGRGYLYHSAADTAQQLDLYALSSTAETVLEAVRQIISDETPSYQSLARQQGGDYTYRQTRQTVIYFGSSMADTQAYIGAVCEPAGTHTVEGNGWTDTYEAYRYSMRWFDGDVPMNTYYQYRNGFLNHIEIRPEETGYTQAQVHDLLSAMYGAPDSEKEGETGWADPIYSKYITLTADEDGCLVTVSGYSVGITNVLSSYPVTDGQADITDPEDRAVWEYLCSILPLEARQKLSQFNLFTDGTSNVLAYTSPVQTEEGTDNTRFCLSIDYYDVYDETGAQRDWSKLTYTILHEYGHVLLEDETQVDLTVGSSTHDPAGFVEGSFRRGFYERFWKELGDSGVGDYDQNPTHYVSRYGANYFHEDIADTFAVFVLGGRPQGNTAAEEKLNFFWADEDMVALRAAIRRNLGLEWPAQAEPAAPERPETPAVSSMEALKAELIQAIAQAEQPPALDISALEGQDDLSMAVKNLYFNILSEYPEYKYAYDLTAQVGGDGLLHCAISYMPYRTGEYPAQFQGTAVDSLAQLVQTAQAGLDQARIPIRITNKALEIDEMNSALQQVGGGYLLCQLNRDATEITVTPQNGMTQEQALARLEELAALADGIVAQVVTDDMDPQARAQALYAYLTEHVRYDFRYYSQPEEMPYDSTTAYGALHDNLAICGGYAQAFQLLLERVDIPCITVSGRMGGENHMWSMARLDGQWLYFDPTSDRGRNDYGFLRFAVQADGLTNYTWDQAQAMAGWAKREISSASLYWVRPG